MFSSIKYGFKLFISYFKANLKSLMVYDMDYILGIIAMMLKTALGLCILFLLFANIDEIDGWNFYEMLFLYGLSTMSFSLWHCFFINTLTIPSYIKSGDFDMLLLKPVNPLFQIMLDGFDEDGWGELLLGLAITIYATVALKVFSLRFILLPFFCLSGCFIFSAISIFLSSIAFFTIGSLDFAENVEDFKEVAKYPVSIFSKPLRLFFSAIIPIAFASYYPALFLLKMDNSYIALAAFPVSALFFFASYRFWSFAMKHYSGSGT